MRQEKGKQRLDEILIREGLVSEAQIREALLRQKADGRRLGSLLLYHRHIEEAQLVKALATQLGCEGVVLSDREIPDSVVKTIPRKIALARKVMPFEYDRGLNTLKIACEDPGDQNLVRELNFVAGGKQIKLFVAPEIALNTAIAKHYLGRDISLDDSLLLEIPEDATEMSRICATGGKTEANQPAGAKPAILLVTDEAFAAPLLQSLLERENYRVVITDSCGAAIKLLENERFDTLLLKESVAGDNTALVIRVRQASPRTAVRQYQTPCSLLLSGEDRAVEAKLLLENLELFSSLLSSKARLPINHAGQVGQYTDKLCRKLGLPEKDRLTITNAAYVHDLARYYYRSSEAKDNRLVIQLTIKLLASLNYSPAVLETLRCTYIDSPQEQADRLPIEVLGGNILTVVDLFCEALPRNDPLTLDKFDAVKKKLRDLVGRMFLAEVVEALVEMIQVEILDLSASQRALQVMIYSQDLSLEKSLELRLKNEGFGTIACGSLEPFLELYQRREPDLMIVMTPGALEDMTSLVDKLAGGGIRFEHTPTFLLTDMPSVSSLTGLLERGIEDIIVLDDNLNMLVSKIRKLRGKICSRAKEKGKTMDDQPGARGRLADMNLIDLIQALGPGRKTVRIKVHLNRPDTVPLTLYLDQGRIMFAQLKDLTGAEAVYEALTWTDGTWTVEPLSTADVPEPNNQFDNESILMEGCRLMDERVKSGQLL